MAEKIGPTVPTIHGADKHTDRTRGIYHSYCGMETDGEIGNARGILLSGTLTKYVACGFRVPEDYSSGGKIFALYAVLGAETGTIYWTSYSQIQKVGYVEISRTPPQPAYPVSVGAQTMKTEVVTFTSSELQVGDVISLKLNRFGDNTSDTCQGYVTLFGLYFEYTADE